MTDQSLDGEVPAGSLLTVVTPDAAALAADPPTLELAGGVRVAPPGTSPDGAPGGGGPLEQRLDRRRVATHTEPGARDVPMTSVSETYMENRHSVQPNHANNLGAVHGGNVMKWMDEYGALSAMRLAGESCVTASVEDLEFRAPVPTGDTVVVQSYVYAAGRTSVRVRVTALQEKPRTGERERTSDSTFVFVAVDEDGDPTPVPDLAVESDRDERLRAAALDGD